MFSDDIAALSIDELGKHITRVSAHLDAGTHALLTAIRRFDDERGYANHGALTCAHWLSHRAGMTPGAARERVRVARALGELPLIDAALSEGKISYAKVRAMTRVATRDNEKTLLDIALYSTGAQLERIVRSYRPIQTACMQQSIQESELYENDPRFRPRDGRHFFSNRMANGMVKLTIILPPEEAELVQKAVEAAQDVAESKNTESAPNEPQSQAMQSADGSESGGDSSGADCQGELDSFAHKTETNAAPAPTISRVDGYCRSRHHFWNQTPAWRVPIAITSCCISRQTSFLKPRPMRTYPRASLLSWPRSTMVVAFPQQRFEGFCATAHPPPWSKTARAIRFTWDEKRALSLPHFSALLRRDVGCRFPGCAHRRHLHAHHVKHWVDGGETNIDNLVLLCSAHHRALHEGDLSVTMEAQSPTFFLRDGRLIEEGAPHIGRFDENRMALVALEHELACRDIDAHLDAQTYGWDGLHGSIWRSHRRSGCKRSVIAATGVAWLFAGLVP